MTREMANDQLLPSLAESSKQQSLELFSLSFPTHPTADYGDGGDAGGKRLELQICKLNEFAEGMARSPGIIIAIARTKKESESIRSGNRANDAFRMCSDPWMMRV